MSELLDELGYDVVDAGSLAEGWRFEAGTPVYCVPLSAGAMRAGLSEAIRT